MGTRPTYTDEQKAKALELYASGDSSSEVSKKTGINRKTIEKWGRERLGERPRMAILRGSTNVAADREAIKQRCLELYESGKSTYQVSEETGVDDSLIYTWVRKAGKNRSRKECSYKRRAPSAKAYKALLDTAKHEIDVLTEALAQIVSRAACAECPHEACDRAGKRGTCDLTGELTAYLLAESKKTVEDFEKSLAA